MNVTIHGCISDDEAEEVVAVVYHETDGAWYPHSIQTRKPRRAWISGVPRNEWPRLEGWARANYDADYSRRAGTVYVHLSGGGGDGNEVFVSPYVEAEAMPGRIWLHPDARLVVWSSEESRNVPMERSGLAAMGYQLLEEMPGDPFSDTEEGSTNWCDACEDNIHEEDTFLCAVCREYAHAHGHAVGHLFVVMDADEAELDAVPGLYRVTKEDWRRDEMFWSSINEGAVDSRSVRRVAGGDSALVMQADTRGGEEHVTDDKRSTRRPRIVLNRWRALAIMTLSYGMATWGAGLLFRFVESQRGIDDLRDQQVTVAFATAMGLCWLVSVVPRWYGPGSKRSLAKRPYTSLARMPSRDGNHEEKQARQDRGRSG